jgi:dTDP-4-amino-4,6-dideoxygalactose transaminase
LLIERERCGLTRDQFLTALHRLKIGTGVHYRAIAAHPVYRERFGWREEDYPIARRVGESTVSLPLSPRLTDADVESVIAAVCQTLS